jgi:hypothetical protein
LHISRLAGLGGLACRLAADLPQDALLSISDVFKLMMSYRIRTISQGQWAARRCAAREPSEVRPVEYGGLIRPGGKFAGCLKFRKVGAT